MGLDTALEPLRDLIGTWRGQGRGSYPTIESFDYIEEVSFVDIGKPFLVYTQRTWDNHGRPMHTETGYLRVPDVDTVEFIISQPTGQAELAEGQLIVEPTGLQLTLQSRVTNTATAKHVDATLRRLILKGDKLITGFGMAAVGQPMTTHLGSVLDRVAA